MSTTIYVLSRNMKKYQSFSSENVQDLAVKFSIYLNRRVFVLKYTSSEVIEKTRIVTTADRTIKYLSIRNEIRQSKPVMLLLLFL